MNAETATLYKTLPLEEQDEVSDFITFIISKRKKNSNPRVSLRQFAGLINDDDAKVMMQASDECRKTENSSEW